MAKHIDADKLIPIIAPAAGVFDLSGAAAPVKVYYNEASDAYFADNGPYFEVVEDLATNDQIVHLGTLADSDAYGICTVPLAANAGDRIPFVMSQRVIPRGTVVVATHVDGADTAGTGFVIGNIGVTRN